MNLGILALVIASALWGTTGTAASFLGSGVSPLAIGSCTMALGGILLFVVSARSSLAAIRDRASRRWVVIGAVGVVVYPLAFYSGMDLAGVAIGNVVALGSGPVFAAILEWLWERQGLTRRWALSTGIAIAGVATLGIAGHADAASASSPASSSSVASGVLLALVAGAAYALYTYSSGRVIRAGHDGRAAMGSTFGIGAVVLLPVLLATGARLLDSGQNMAIAAYLVIGPMFVAYLLFGFGIGALRSSVVTTITLIEPVVATILAVVVVGERLTIAGWVGIAAIFLGLCVLISARPANKTERRP